MAHYSNIAANNNIQYLCVCLHHQHWLAATRLYSASVVLHFAGWLWLSCTRSLLVVWLLKKE